ncbi:hypothetical protein BJ875DRAFT_42104 [Amylocarpus encephaloides]|uniref:Extracellular membrane protein CFEM domain-containing protein n=1 Tax=Amylocarpus encephaloides TaxID=45428 RepID=A0A9P7YH81_9HELO|nr:hypothetical protein BJ875DRAFT_42104 [Amylocarpus encephaloides]
MLAALPVIVLLQALGAGANLVEELHIRHVILAREPAPALVGDVVKVFDGSPVVVARQNPTGCLSALSAIDFCSSVSPGFLTYSATRQAPCLCYSSATWVPGIFDGWVSSCAGYARTAEPSVYPIISSLGGFCSSVGNVRGNRASRTTTASFTTDSTTTSSTSSPTITSKPTSISGNGGFGLGNEDSGCSVVSSLLNSCVTTSRGFTDLETESQAACLCYRSSSWVPSTFDNGIQTCAEYIKTAHPTDYSVVSALGGFCTGVGDVLKPSTTMTLTGGDTSPSTIVGNTGVPGVPTDMPNTPTSDPTNTDPVTVTADAGAAQTPAVSASAPTLSVFSNMCLAITSLAVTAVLFL